MTNLSTKGCKNKRQNRIEHICATAEVEANAKTTESIKEPDPILIQRLVEKFESLGESFCTTCL